MSKTREERVRERAYEIWEQEGRTHGRDAEHWRRAEAEIAAEERQTTSTESTSAQIAADAGATTAGPTEREKADAAPVRSRPAGARKNGITAPPNGARPKKSSAAKSKPTR
ncbi:MAG: DUF2934 domain-containing protein [Rhodospirillales bacterium]|nr:DUF2934 domain-containing protein [Rhodospirillales bacterium]